MTRRRYQRGCLFLRGSKRKVWALRYREDVMLADGTIARTQRSEVIGSLVDLPTLRMAQRAADGRMFTQNHAGLRPQTILTFREFVETLWKQNLLPTFKFSTRRGYDYLLRKYLEPFFGDWQLADVARPTVQAFVAQMGKTLAPKSVCLAKNLLSKVFSTAVDWGYVRENPVKGIRLPSRQTRREPNTLEPVQVRQLVAQLPEPASSMVLIAVLTGLRRGELFALRWGALDFGKKLIQVREAVYEGHFSTPKTRSSIRTLPMGDVVAAALLRLRPAKPTDTGLVFVDAKGRLLRPDNMLKRIIQPACVSLGFPKVGWHDLRHTSATLLHATEPLRVVQAILGHSDIQTTLGYTHTLPSWQREAMERLEKGVLFPSVPKSQEEPKEVSSLIQ